MLTHDGSPATGRTTTDRRGDYQVETQGNDGSPFVSAVTPDAFTVPGISPLDPGWSPTADPAAQAPAPLAPQVAPQVAPSLAPVVAPPVAVPPAVSVPDVVVASSVVGLAPDPTKPPATDPAPGADTVTPMEKVEHDAAYTRSALEEESDTESALLSELLIQCQEMGASDLHITSGARPTLRLQGSLVPLEDRPLLTPPVIQRMMYAILTQKQRENFEEILELDFAYALPGRARFRVNLYRQRDSLGAAFRIIPYEIKALEELGVPPSVANFAMLPRGFVLVTGPTGSGKSTTLASLVDLANRQRRDHIMTVEDPIEFLHTHKSCLVNQREIGEDTWSFQNALKHVLRQDPDIILVGEMRDLETISVALTAAETGHLVFATLHTQDAAQTIDRVIDVFPPHQQQQVRVQLAGALQGVVCQTLCKTYDGKGRAVATEVLVATPAIRNLIREGKTHQIYSSLQSGGKHGMHTLDQHLAELVKAGRVTYETGLEKCHHVEDFNRLTGRG
jgi:twitching motility protein PilT